MKTMAMRTAKDVAHVMAVMRKHLKTHLQTVVRLQGPVGSGKLMVARRLHALLPPPSAKDLELLLWLHVRLRATEEHLAAHGAFRAPHHTISHAGMMGGVQGHRLFSGEVSLAHAGTLLLDETIEFRPAVLEDLFHVMRSGHILYGSSHADSLMVPSKPRLVVLTTLSCPCGQLPRPQCSCQPVWIDRYHERVDTWLEHAEVHTTISLDLSDDAKAKLETYAR